VAAPPGLRTPARRVGRCAPRARGSRIRRGRAARGAGPLPYPPGLADVFALLLTEVERAPALPEPLEVRVCAPDAALDPIVRRASPRCREKRLHSRSRRDALHADGTDPGGCSAPLIGPRPARACARERRLVVVLEADTPFGRPAHRGVPPLAPSPRRDARRRPSAPRARGRARAPGAPGDRRRRALTLAPRAAGVAAAPRARLHAARSIPGRRAAHAARHADPVGHAPAAARRARGATRRGRPGVA
jgi:hypothetical protein